MKPTTPVAPVDRLTIDDLELLGMEVIHAGPTDSRGVVWLPLNAGLTTLYGRNGAGKTSVLRAAQAAFTGVRPPGVTVRLYARLLAAEAEAVSVEERNRQQFEHDLEMWRTTAQPSGEIIVVDGRELELFDDMPKVPTDGVPPSGWMFRRLVSAVPVGCEFYRIDRDNLTSMAAPEWWQFDGPGFSVEQLDAETWAEFQYPEFDQVVRMLLLGNAALDDAHRQPRMVDEGLDPVDPVVYEVCAESASSRLLCFESTGTAQLPQWTVYLAGQVVGSTAAARLLRRSVGETETATAGHCDPKVLELMRGQDFFGEVPGPEQFLPLLADTVGSSMMVTRVQQEAEFPETGGVCPFAPLGSFWSNICIDSFPISVEVLTDLHEPQCRIDAFIDSLAAASTVGRLTVEDGEIGWAGTDIASINDVNDHLARISAVIAGARVGISGVRVALVGGVAAALRGGLLAVEACDQLTGTWGHVSDLSSGQRMWVGFVLAIHSGLDRKRTVLIADEVDRGVADVAVVPLLMTLERLFPAVLLASHSPSVVRSRVGSMRHVWRRTSGDIEVGLLDGVVHSPSLAQSLGVAPIDLLTFVRVFVVVSDPNLRHELEVVLEWQRSGVPDVKVVLAAASATGVIEALAPLVELTDATIVVAYRDDVKSIGRVLEQTLSAASSLGVAHRVSCIEVPPPQVSSSAYVTLLDEIENASFRSALSRL